MSRSNELSEEQLIGYDELVRALYGPEVNEIAEMIRRQKQHDINEDALPLEELQRRHGQVWNTQDMARDFVVEGFGAPLVVVTRKADQKMGTLYFQHQPRFYWGFQEDRV